MGQIRYADQVLEHARQEYIEPAAGQPPSESPLLRLWGIGKEVFQSLGGGEAFIRSEREQWGPGEIS